MHVTFLYAQEWNTVGYRSSLTLVVLHDMYVRKGQSLCVYPKRGGGR